VAVKLDEQRAILLGAREGELLTGPKHEIYVRYEGPEYEVLEFFCEPGFGPVVPHVHEDHADSFFILEGEVEFTIGDETVRAGPGTWVAAPPGVRHGFAIPGPERAHFLNIHAPGTGFIAELRGG
jgi:mannose-6-phosphate isomerase-like protein (cupin superfamily)